MPIKLRALYVKRNVINKREILTWAKSVGFQSLIKPKELHVTEIYSRKPVDWEAMGPDLYSNSKGQLIIPAHDGPRMLSPLGDEGAVVLKFYCSALTTRHREMRRMGCSWDFPSYFPHITLTYHNPPANLHLIKPYTGKIILSKEIFEDLDEDWAAEKASTEEASSPVNFEEVSETKWKVTGDSHYAFITKTKKGWRVEFFKSDGTNMNIGSDMVTLPDAKANAENTIRQIETTRGKASKPRPVLQ